MRQLIMACAILPLAGCLGVLVEARGPDGITINPMFENLQAVEDEAVAHCQRTGRRARMFGSIRGSNGQAYRYECL